MSTKPKTNMFETALDAIARDPKRAYLHARDVIKGRFPKGEDAINRDLHYARCYAHDVPGKKGNIYENLLLDDIASDPKRAYYYALNIVKGRFPEGEDAIAKDPVFSFLYARDIIKGEWPKGERAINNNPKYADVYKRYFMDN